MKPGSHPALVKVTASIAAAALLLSCSPLAIASTSPSAALTPREQALHVLNRLGFGPRPGDVERVLAVGVGAYVDGQLAPEKIPDAAVLAKLQALPTLAMGNAEIFDRFEKPMREAKRARKQKEGESAGADQAAELEKLRAMIPPENRPRRIVEELSAARVIRAADSPRQLQEVLV